MPQLRNTTSSYGLISRKLHALIAVLFILMLICGMVMGWLPAGEFRHFVNNAHKVTGVTLLTLMLFFVFWSLLNPKPKYPDYMPAWNKTLASITRELLYITALLMPLSGWVMSTASGKPPHFFNWGLPMPWIPLNNSWASFAYDVHGFLAWVLASLITIHILGALKHHLIDKDDVLKRMKP